MRLVLPTWLQREDGLSSELSLFIFMLVAIGSGIAAMIRYVLDWPTRETDVLAFIVLLGAAIGVAATFAVIRFTR